MEEQFSNGTACALGFFDGVHCAHAAIVENVVSYAAKNNLTAISVTFKKPPKEMLGNKSLALLQTHEQRVATLKDMGIEKIVFLDQSHLALNSKQFGAWLADKNVKYAACGFNYRFGCDKADGDDLVEVGNNNDFKVFILPEMKINGHTVSSSQIRNALLHGDVQLAAVLLGRNHSVTAEVVHGKGLAAALGFATANILPANIVPKNGVYATRTYVGNECHLSITNVGTAPTFGEFPQTVETFIFNFDRNIYGMPITVEFLRKIRDEQKFESVEQLQMQITKDLVSAGWNASGNKKVKKY